MPHKVNLTHEVHKMLAISTAHVTGHTAAVLDSLECPCVCYDKDGVGWFIPVPEKTEPSVLNRYPDDLLDVFRIAWAHGYTWVMFDCDVCPHADLPTYEW